MRAGRLLERTLRTLERAQGDQFIIYRDKPYVCTVNVMSRGQTLELGGWAAEVQCTVFVRKSLMEVVTADSTVILADNEEIEADSDTPAPHPGKRSTVRRRPYRIARVREDGTGVFWALDLVDPSGKA